MTGDDQVMIRRCSDDDQVMIDDDRIAASGIHNNTESTSISMMISDDQRWRQKVLQATVSSPGSFQIDVQCLPPSFFASCSLDFSDDCFRPFLAMTDCSLTGWMK